MSEQTPETSIKENIKTPSTWLRGLYMLLFVIIYGIAEFVLTAVVIFQFLSMVFVRRTNDRLREFGQDLSVFIYKILLFLTYNSEEKPFPFDNWPARAGAISGSTVDQPS